MSVDNSYKNAVDVLTKLVSGLVNPPKMGLAVINLKKPDRILQTTWDLAISKIRAEMDNTGGGPQRERGYDNQRRRGNQKER